MFSLIKHKKELSPTFLTLCIISFIWLTGDTILEFIFPTYLEKIGLSFFAIGVLLSLPSLFGMIIDLPIGDLNDRISRKKLMITGLVGSIILASFIFTVKSVILIGIGLALWGAFYQIWRVTRDTYLVAITKPEFRSTMFGIDSAFLSLALTIGPLIAGITLSYFGIISNLILYILFLIIAIVTISLMIKSKNHHKIEVEIGRVIKNDKIFLKSIQYLKLFGHQGFILLFLSFIYTMTESFVITMEPLFYGPNGLNLSPTLGGLIFAMFFLPGILLSQPSGWLGDKFGKKLILIIGMVISGISLIAFSATINIKIILISAFFTAAGTTLMYPNVKGLIGDILYKHKKGEFIGSVSVFSDLGYIIGPILGGLIAQFFGVRKIFLIAGIIFILSIIVALFINTKKEFHGTTLLAELNNTYK